MDEAEEARSGEEEQSGDEEPADGEDIANSVWSLYKDGGLSKKSQILLKTTKKVICSI